MKFFSTLAMTAMLVAGSSAMGAETVHDFKVKSLEDKDVNLADYKGKVLLVVNVASKCGATPQYEQLEGLHEKYGEQGLVVMGFPCNQFGGQEPGTAKEIREFCDATYQVKFPMFAKVAVNGDDQTPLYTFLKSHANEADDVKWNFEKFLIGKDGKVIARFRTRTRPDSPEVVAAIEKALKD
ncbi:MAG: glutathione peroxidase [Planctomycetaceae bacterium]|nr:glutathione peroxidase [Planctomycetaceae bacterium]